jgi:hypothetical protein
MCLATREAADDAPGGDPLRGEDAKLVPAPPGRHVGVGTTDERDGVLGAGLEDGRQDRVDGLGGAAEGEEAERVTRGSQVRVDEGARTAALGIEKRRWRGHRGSRGSA